jgi:hypothetical protein
MDFRFHYCLFCNLCIILIFGQVSTAIFYSNLDASKPLMSQFAHVVVCIIGIFGCISTFVCISGRVQHIVRVSIPDNIILRYALTYITYATGTA